MKSRAFTLIELLVVISIIGVLSSIVLASLNTARSKGAIAAIKSNLKNMISAAELSYDAVNPNSYTNTCATVAGMITAIGNAGGVAGCWTYDNTRWGASAKLNSNTTKNYSVDSTGVVTWDTTDISGPAITWDAANSACVASGGRLPSYEQLKALSLAYASVAPPGFQVSNYWSSTVDPANSANAHIVYLFNGNTYGASYPKTNTYYARCVRQ